MRACKQDPAIGFLRCWHQFFPLEWWEFTERLRAASERSREAQVMVFGSGVVKTFIMKREKLCNAALLLQHTVQNLESVGWKS